VTPDQVEILRLGMDVYTFAIGFETRPPYSIEASLRTEKVASIAKGRGGTKIHTTFEEAGPEAPVTREASHSAENVFASAESASRACMACIDGLDKGIKFVKKNFREAVKAERDRLRGSRPESAGARSARDPNAPPRRKPGRRSRAEIAAERAAAEAEAAANPPAPTPAPAPATAEAPAPILVTSEAFVPPAPTPAPEPESTIVVDNHGFGVAEGQPIANGHVHDPAHAAHAESVPS
jgi:hypothetical protein